MMSGELISDRWEMFQRCVRGDYLVRNIYSMNSTLTQNTSDESSEAYGAMVSMLTILGNPIVGGNEKKILCSCFKRTHSRGLRS
jgi:hypothetical protein